MHVLIDADVVTYKAGFASESRSYVDTDAMRVYPTKRQAENLGANMDALELQQIPATEEWARGILKNTIEGILRATNATSYETFLTHTDGSKNYRTQVAVTHKYKGQRTKYAKPIHYGYIRDLLISEYGARVVEGYEADDELGIQQSDDTIIASIDKDLLMIPGLHYNMNTKKILMASDPGELSLIRKGKKTGLTGHGFKWFCAQMLLGDEVDNIVCIKRYGPVRVFKALEKATTPPMMMDVVWKIYKDKETLDRLEENAILLWIQRKGIETWQQYLETYNDI